MSAEIIEAGGWIKTKLEADATFLTAIPSGCYMDKIPEGVALPAVRIQCLSPSDVMGVGQKRIASNLTFIVVIVVNSANLASIVAASARLDAVLHGNSGDSPGASFFVQGCTRDAPYHARDEQDQVPYVHTGGIYRLIGYAH